VTEVAGNDAVGRKCDINESCMRLEGVVVNKTKYIEIENVCTCVGMYMCDID
jgi:hypothetical protein